MAMKVAGALFSLLSTMYWRSPTSARATSPTRTMALPSWLARRMIFSNWRGSVNWPCVTTGKVSCTGAALGCWPICPAPKSAFCALMALAMSLVVTASEAMRSGFIQMRIAWSGTPMICAWPAPGTRFSASST
jgi:hypothetical protein